MVELRAATVEDARALAEVQNEGWRWGYRGLVPQDVLDARDDDWSEQRWTAAFTDEWRLGDAAFLAEEDGRAIGMIACGPPNTIYGVPAPERSGEVLALYLREAAQGRGIGKALLALGQRHLRDAGFDRAVLWVIPENSLARRFYEAAGWAPDGVLAEHRFDDVVIAIMRYAVDL